MSKTNLENRTESQNDEKKTKKIRTSEKESNDPFTKVFLNWDLYNTSEEEIKALENWSWDPLVVRETKEIFRPIFNDIQKEREEAKKQEAITIRCATRKDFQGLIALNKRIRTGGIAGLKPCSDKDLQVRLNNGVIFVATTKSGYIIGTISLLVGTWKNAKFGYDALVMVSQLFQRQGIGKKLFNAILEWARNEGLTDFSTPSLTDMGYKLVEQLAKKRKDVKIVYGPINGAAFIIKNRFEK